MFFEIDNLNKSFGGVKATNGVNLTVKKGEVCSLIGPNGAGKTTLFNLITGFLKSDSGKIIFGGNDITNTPIKFIVQQGIARSFQIVNLFQKLSVYENIMVAVLSNNEMSLNTFRNAKKIMRSECLELLESIGLSEKANIIAGNLSHGDQKRLEVGLAIAMKPKFLLLDEPTAGMAIEEKSGILKTIRNMMTMYDCTILLSEHDMSVIFNISDSIWVLHNGSIIAHGTKEEIKQNKKVKSIYLGEDYE